MVVQRINFNLQVRVVVQQSRVRESGAFELLSHEHNLVFFRSDLHFQVFDICGHLDVSLRLRVDSLLEVTVLVSVFLLQALQMVKFVLEGDNLVLKLNDFTLAVVQLGLFVFQIKGFGVN